MGASGRQRPAATRSEAVSTWEETCFGRSRRNRIGHPVAVFGLSYRHYFDRWYKSDSGHALLSEFGMELSRIQDTIPSTSATTDRHSLPNHCLSPILPFHSETSYTSQPITSLFKLTPIRHVDTVISASRPIFDIERAA